MFQLVKREDLLLFFVLCVSKVNIFVFWPIVQVKQDIWRHHLGLWDIIFQYFKDQTINQLIEKIIDWSIIKIYYNIIWSCFQGNKRGSGQEGQYPIITYIANI